MIFSKNIFVTSPVYCPSSLCSNKKSDKIQLKPFSFEVVETKGKTGLFSGLLMLKDKPKMTVNFVSELGDSINSKKPTSHDIILNIFFKCKPT